MRTVPLSPFFLVLRHLLAAAFTAWFAGFPAISEPGSPVSSAKTSFKDWDHFTGTVEDVVTDGCVITTRSVRTEIFITFGHHGDQFRRRLTIRDARWDIEEKSIKYRFYMRSSSYWTLDAYAVGDRLIHTLTDDGNTPEFLEDLASYSTLRLTTEEGKELARFSLAGSRAALSALKTCEARLLAESVAGPDPFRGEEDPF